ncbi:YncE family protein [Nocardia seriolae]|nr:YncE family protein [Nocardia seriolae]MTJ71331.1 YncE family protein [Nocardia seriolae]MTJ88562.1 YncE family protein [Nocardia seriolae]MTK32546.1 YncE family protein [Nocardia seriolae]MTK41887.1 YncE family protein [Nocardia seriolae]
MAGIALAAGCSAAPTTTGGALPLHRVAEVALTGGSSRFDYASLDSARGLLFLAHMGADEIVEVDVRAHTVVRTITDTPDVHGVLVVPEQHRVYATVTGRDQVVALDEDTGAVQFSTATGNYPDGLAYDPLRKAVWTTNERAGTETVVDAVSGTLRGTVSLGGEVGNVVYEPAADRMIVAVQGKDELAVIAPDSLTVESRMQTPGCAGPHGQVLDPAASVMFVGCEDNAVLLTVDLASRSITDRSSVGKTPDVLAYDAGTHRVYVAAESGGVSTFDRKDGHTAAAGSERLADGAHVVAVDPATHHTYFPVPAGGSGGGPVLWEFEPTG